MRDGGHVHTISSYEEKIVVMATTNVLRCMVCWNILVCRKMLNDVR